MKTIKSGRGERNVHRKNQLALIINLVIFTLRINLNNRLDIAQDDCWGRRVLNHHLHNPHRLT